MSIFNLDDDRIVRIFWANGVKISLKKAFEVANIIYGAHLERVNEVSNNSYDTGKTEGLRHIELEKETAYQNGYTTRQRQVNYIAEGEHIRRVISATLWAERRFDHDNLLTKVPCIKKVRENFPLLGLRDCKDIVQACSGEGYGMTL